MPYLVDPVVPPGTMARRRQPVLGDAELTIRPFIASDADALMAAYADPGIQRWHARTLDSLDEACASIAEWNRCWDEERSARWAVADATTGDLLGQVGLRSVDLAGGEADVSYWVMPEARGRGVATCAVRTVTDWAFHDLGLHRLEVHHSVENPESCRVADRAEFVLEGTMAGKALHADGWHDMHLHGRIHLKPSARGGAHR